MNVIFSPEAIEDLRLIEDFIADDNPRAASETVVKIKHTADMLGLFPLMGRVGRVDETREMLATRTYIIIYTLLNETDLVVLNVVHTAQKYP